jgi:hypothetical protein
VNRPNRRVNHCSAVCLLRLCSGAPGVLGVLLDDAAQSELRVVGQVVRLVQDHQLHARAAHTHTNTHTHSIGLLERAHTTLWWFVVRGRWGGGLELGGQSVSPQQSAVAHLKSRLVPANSLICSRTTSMPLSSDAFSSSVMAPYLGPYICLRYHRSTTHHKHGHPTRPSHTQSEAHKHTCTEGE